MLPLVIVSTCLSGVILGLALYYTPKLLAIGQQDREWVAHVQALDARMERLELRWHGTLEELQQRLEDGNREWRKVRQRAYYARRQEELAEGEEGQPSDGEQEILDFDARGSDPRGLSYMPEAVGNSPEPTWRAVGRELARQIAGKGTN